MGPTSQSDAPKPARRTNPVSRRLTRTLYSKQATQRCNSSRSRLVCGTERSESQRSSRAVSAFFSTQRKQASSVRLHSAEREPPGRPACANDAVVLIHRIALRARPLTLPRHTFTIIPYIAFILIAPQGGKTEGPAQTHADVSRTSANAHTRSASGSFMRRVAHRDTSRKH